MGALAFIAEEGCQMHLLMHAASHQGGIPTIEGALSHFAWVIVYHAHAISPKLIEALLAGSMLRYYTGTIRQASLISLIFSEMQWLQQLSIYIQ